MITASVARPRSGQDRITMPAIRSRIAVTMFPPRSSGDASATTKRTMPATTNQRPTIRVKTTSVSNGFLISTRPASTLSTPMSASRPRPSPLLKIEAKIASTPSTSRKMPAMTVNVLSVSCGETTKNRPTPRVTTPNSTNSHQKLVTERRLSAGFVDMVHPPVTALAGSGSRCSSAL